MSKKLDGPKIVFFDLETLPDLLQALRVWPSMSDWHGKTMKATINSIICFGYRTESMKKAKVIRAWDFPERWNKDVNDDFEICKAAYEILKDADVIVTQNGRKFDLPFLQTRLAKYRHPDGRPIFPPLPKIIHVDTKVEAKKHFFLYDNSLNTMGYFLLEREKMKHDGWAMWVDVYFRKQKAMDTMSRYCGIDVDVLKGVFDRMRPYITILPNMNMWRAEKMNCPACGSLNIQKRGFRTTKTKVVQRLQCNEDSCGAWSSVGLRDPFPKGGA